MSIYFRSLYLVAGLQMSKWSSGRVYNGPELSSAESGGTKCKERLGYVNSFVGKLSPIQTDFHPPANHRLCKRPNTLLSKHNTK